MVRRPLRVLAVPHALLALNQAPVLVLRRRKRRRRREQRLGVARPDERLHRLHLPTRQLRAERVLEQRAEQVRARPERGQLHDLCARRVSGAAGTLRKGRGVGRTNLELFQVASESA